MRVADRPTPPIDLHTDPRLDRWPVRPVVGISGLRNVAEWDDPDLVWDPDAVILEWDMDTVAGFVDATCETHGIEIDVGDPDEHGNFPAGRAVLQLDNTTGSWSQYTVNGTQAEHGPGYEVALWARYRDDGSEWWMFRGKISRWDEIGDTIVVEAFDAFSDLALPIGIYTPGVNGQSPAVRLETIVVAAGKTGLARRFATGTVALTAQETEAAPLEEMQTVASSDGEALFVDADGTIISLARNWRIGRTDQISFPVASDNVCTVPIIVWDAVLSTNDAGLAQTVIFQNVAKLRAIAPAGASVIDGLAFAETDHQWTTQTEGDTLAAVVQGQHSEARVNIDEFDLYLWDERQPELFHAVEWRLFDVLRFIHDQRAIGGTNRLDTNTLIKTISHSITPDNWVMSVQTSRAMAPNAVLVWNPPDDPYAWNSSGAVWGF